MTETGTPGGGADAGGRDASGPDANRPDAGPADADLRSIARDLRAALRAADGGRGRALGPGPAADAHAWAGVRARVERRRRRRRAAPAVAAAAAAIAVLGGTVLADVLADPGPAAGRAARPSGSATGADASRRVSAADGNACLDAATDGWATAREGVMSIDIPGGGTAAAVDGGADGLVLAVMRRAPEERECRREGFLPRSTAAMRWTSGDGAVAWVGTTVPAARSFLVEHAGGTLEFECGSRDRAAEANCHRWSAGGREALMFATRPRPAPSGERGEPRPGVVRALDENGRVVDSMTFVP